MEDVQLERENSDANILDSLMFTHFLRGWLLVVSDESDIMIDDDTFILDDDVADAVTANEKKRSDTMMILRSVSIVRFFLWICRHLSRIQIPASVVFTAAGDKEQNGKSCILSPPRHLSSSAQRRSERYRFYIYELGPNLQPWLNESEDVGQYSMGSIVYERLLHDPRRTRNPLRASLFVVPIDLSRFRFGEGKLESEQICAKIKDVQNIVQGIRFLMNEKKKMISMTSSSLQTRKAQLKKRRDQQHDSEIIDKNESLPQTHIYHDHIVPIARVASSMYWGWGKSCPEVYDWLRRMQWLTIEPHYKIDKILGEAVLDLSDKFPSGGASRHHMVPYPTGIRLRSTRDAHKLVALHSWVNRTFLVAQVLGEHERRGSSLRPHLKIACARMAPNVCAIDWKQARHEFIKKLRRRVDNHPLIDFADAVVQSTPYFALYASATFCIQPPGITPSRAAVFQCLLAGGIPVFFERFIFDALDPLINHNFEATTLINATFSSRKSISARPWAIIVSTKRAIVNPFAEVYGRLARMPADTVAQMQSTIAEAAIRLQYAHTDSKVNGDAYDYCLEASFHTVPWCT